MTSKGKDNQPHIGIFGRCNAGKSTLMNFITGAATAIVSPRPGTTTDPVRKSYEILDFSPVVLIDTAGMDDPSAIGEERMRRTAEEARRVDLALLVFRQWGLPEEELVGIFARQSIPFVTIRNVEKGCDTPAPADMQVDLMRPGAQSHTELMDLIKGRLPAASRQAVKMLGGMLAQGDNVVLVCPIDGGAPAGRMILPQVQAIREVLDAGAVALVAQPRQLEPILAGQDAIRMVVTDSQVYKEVRAMVPAQIEVTTFSILLASAKGDYQLYTEGLAKVDDLHEGDRILVAEFCSHQTSCDDIARVKIPRWMESYAGCNLQFTYLGPGEAMPADASNYALMLFCGGCMATRTVVRSRIAQARGAGLPVTNFGLLIRKIR